MFALPPVEPEIGDLQPLHEAIGDLCEVVGGDRETVIRGLAEIVRRRAEFEALRQMDLDPSTSRGEGPAGCSLDRRLGSRFGCG